MTRLISIDTVNTITSSGIVEMRSALDMDPMPSVAIEGVPTMSPTPHTWADCSIMLRPGLTIAEVERMVMGSFDELFVRYEILSRRAGASDDPYRARHIERVLRARGIITTP